MDDEQHPLARRTSILLLLAILLVVSMMLASVIGPVRIPLSSVSGLMLSRMPLLGDLIRSTWSETDKIILLQIRLPRIIAGALVGIALAISGATMQGLFKNPMADPYIIGISSGAALGAVTAIVIKLDTGFGGVYGISILAFIGALLAMFIVYNIARVGGRLPMGTLLLSGIAVASFLAAVTSLLMYLSGENLHKIVFWIMGGLWSRNWGHVQMALPWILIGAVLMHVFARDLNVMLMGEEQAQTMGVEVETVKKILLVSATMTTAAAVSISGIIGFVGLIIPHIMRLIVGPDHRMLLPASALMGGSFLIWADTLARTVIAPTELPVGIITAMFGAPFFIYLLRTRKRVSMGGNV